MYIYNVPIYLLTIQNPSPITHLLSPQHDATDPIDLCDKHCERASPGGSATDCVCVFSRWSLNGTLIDLGNDYRRHMSGGSLIISNLDKDQDTGVYQCVAFNTWGSILSRRASLQFACKWSHNCSHVFLAWLWHILWHPGIALQSAVHQSYVCNIAVAQAFFFLTLLHSLMPISHLDCLRIDFSKGEMEIEWNVRCNKHSQRVRPLLTSSELHWFSLAAPTRDSICLRLVRNWLILLPSDGASPCDQDFNRDEHEWPLRGVRISVIARCFWVLNIEQIDRGSVTVCQAAAQNTKMALG